MEEELKLAFVKYVGEETGGLNVYEFIFTEHINSFWGVNFEYKPAGLCNELIPSETYIDKIHRIKMNIKLSLIQDSYCFSFQDAIDGIVALCYEDIDDYEEYPKDGRLVFKFGEDYNEVERKLAMKKILIMD